MKREKKLTILTAAASQQVAMFDIAKLLAGVPARTYARRFYPARFNIRTAFERSLERSTAGAHLTTAG